MSNESQYEEKRELVRLIKQNPYLFGKKVGFKKLTALNNEWIKDMVFNPDKKGDTTLQAHRSSYKTTSVSVSLCLIMIFYPDETTIFFRKTDTAVKEIIHQVSKMLKNETTRKLVKALYGKDLQIVKETAFELSTNLTDSPRGTSQLCSSGIKSSITGQHYDRIFTDDIVTLDDRTSRAEREETKTHYYELLNLINEGGRIYNTGTPWHKDDCFCVMPEAEKYDCYTTGIMSEETIAEKKEDMPPSLFAANYELRHIAAEDVIFDGAVTGADITKILNAPVVHVDAAYGGEDYTAMTICKKTEGKYYILGRLWHKAVDECMDNIIAEMKKTLAGKIYCETNSDKGYLAKAFRDRGQRVITYNEGMNKYIKIVTHLKGDWKNVVFVEGTDKEYVEQILDYNEFAEHDDAPDSAACAIRILHPQKNAEDKVSGFGY